MTNMTDTTPTPTPETDAKHVELGIEYSVMSASYYEMRKHARAMESRALAAEAEVERLRRAEPRVWAKPIEHEDVCQCPKCGVFHDTTGAPLYTAPAPDAVVEVASHEGR